MATKGSTSRKGTTSGGPALDRLGGSLEAAQEALKDLRRELSKGGRDLVKDLDVLLRDARKNLRGVQRTLIKDLEEMQKAAAGKRRSQRQARQGGRPRPRAARPARSARPPSRRPRPSAAVPHRRASRLGGRGRRASPSHDAATGFLIVAPRDGAGWQPMTSDQGQASFSELRVSRMGTGLRPAFWNADPSREPGIERGRRGYLARGGTRTPPVNNETMQDRHPARSSPAAALALAVAVALVGCGGDDRAAEAQRANCRAQVENTAEAAAIAKAYRQGDLTRKEVKPASRPTTASSTSRAGWSPTASSRG